MISADVWPGLEQFISVGDLIFSALFALDVTIRILVLGVKFFKVCMNYVDLGVTIASLAEIFIFAATPSGFVNPVLFRLLRIGKLARALRMVTMSNVLASLQLLLKCLAASMDMLFWTFCLLTFLQCVAGMIVSTLARDFITDEEKDLELRLAVFKYYGTFTRTFLSMFEILFANWAPPCRAVVEAISEWFSVFFLLYRCVLGFAVLNVVNAVFVQQTMKTASSDEDLAFKQKQKDAAVYTKKVKKLFQTMDASGDGAINLQEFAKLVKSPKLKFWMSQLELEYHDLLSLFEFLDNGDGQITLKELCCEQEFIEGAGRLRGGAKALDIWRLETKVEVLFGEIMSELQNIANDEELSHQKTVEDVFANSNYRHIGSAVKMRSEPATPGHDSDDEEMPEGASSGLRSTSSQCVQAQMAEIRQDCLRLRQEQDAEQETAKMAWQVHKKAMMEKDELILDARKVAYGGILIVQPVLMDAGGSWGQNKASRPRWLRAILATNRHHARLHGHCIILRWQPTQPQLTKWQRRQCGKTDEKKLVVVWAAPGRTYRSGPTPLSPPEPMGAPCHRAGHRD
eukprot:g6808.t1